MGITELWTVVNNAKTNEDILKAEFLVKKSVVDSYTYDELMTALSKKSRNVYYPIIGRECADFLEEVFGLNFDLERND